MNSTEKFYEDLRLTLDRELELAGDNAEGTTKEILLTNKIVNDLTEGSTPALRGLEEEAFRWENPSCNGKINGFFLDYNEHSAIAYITYYGPNKTPFYLNQPEVESNFKKLNAFMQQIVTDPSGLLSKIEEDHPLYSFVYNLVHNHADYDSYNYVLITNGLIREMKLPQFKIFDKRVDSQIIDLERYKRFKNGQKITEINATKELLQTTIPCVSFLDNNPNYDTYCCILTGEIIYNLFDMYHYQLLNSNVRTYLQLRGTVNQGIMNTIEKNPSNFLAYNNGISATSSSIELNSKNEIISIKDFQIVNGGQTSASIYNAKANKGFDIKDISVLVKITVIKNEKKRDEIVKNISKYANTQNVIKFSDLSANDLYNKTLCELSKNIYTPSINNALPTKWYYEAVAGTYKLEKNEEGTKFEKEYPQKQFFDKTNMAIYEFAFQGSPVEACLGAQDAYKVFALSLDSLDKPNEIDFKHLVAKKIIFDTILMILNEIGGQGKKAIASYVMAYLSTISCVNTINLDSIWEKQAVSDAMFEDVKVLAINMSDYLRAEANKKMISVDMFCRRKSTWEETKKLSFSVKNSLLYTGTEKYTPKIRTWKISVKFAKLFESVPTSDWNNCTNIASKIAKDSKEKNILVYTFVKMSTLEISQATEWDIAFGLRLLLRAYRGGCELSDRITQELKENEESLYEITKKSKNSFSCDTYFEVAKVDENTFRERKV